MKIVVLKTGDEVKIIKGTGVARQYEGQIVKITKSYPDNPLYCEVEAKNGHSFKLYSLDDTFEPVSKESEDLDKSFADIGSLFNKIIRNGHKELFPEEENQKIKYPVVTGIDFTKDEFKRTKELADIGNISAMLELIGHNQLVLNDKLNKLLK